ncbi:hypothetical protein M404DRAFT_999037, partial [Pisolithus tinctorius Marx 270]
IPTHTPVDSVSNVCTRSFSWTSLDWYSIAQRAFGIIKIGHETRRYDTTAFLGLVIVSLKTRAHRRTRLAHQCTQTASDKPCSSTGTFSHRGGGSALDYSTPWMRATRYVGLKEVLQAREKAADRVSASL